MADVRIDYKGNTIAELDSPGSKTLKTGGFYCDSDIMMAYAPRSRTYEITLTKSSGWVLLTELDEDVLAHINDPGLIVTLRCTDEYSYDFYAGTCYTVGNNQIGTHSAGPIYGIGNRKTSETVTSSGSIFAPANNSVKSAVSGSFATFAVVDGKYYIEPGNGFINAGKWRLVFVW